MNEGKRSRWIMTLSQEEKAFLLASPSNTFHMNPHSFCQKLTSDSKWEGCDFFWCYLILHMFWNSMKLWMSQWVWVCSHFLPLNTLISRRDHGFLPSLHQRGIKSGHFCLSVEATQSSHVTHQNDETAGRQLKGYMNISLNTTLPWQQIGGADEVWCCRRLIGSACMWFASREHVCAVTFTQQRDVWRWQLDCFTSRPSKPHLLSQSLFFLICCNDEWVTYFQMLFLNV